jgi:hypothetical protein
MASSEIHPATPEVTWAASPTFSQPSGRKSGTHKKESLADLEIHAFFATTNSIRFWHKPGIPPGFAMCGKRILLRLRIFHGACYSGGSAEIEAAAIKNAGRNASVTQALPSALSKLLHSHPTSQEVHKWLDCCHENAPSSKQISCH